jgi:hypothetical protein
LQSSARGGSRHNASETREFLLLKRIQFKRRHLSAVLHLDFRGQEP